MVGNVFFVCERILNYSIKPNKLINAILKRHLIVICHLQFKFIKLQVVLKSFRCVRVRDQGYIYIELNLNIPKYNSALLFSPLAIKPHETSVSVYFTFDLLYVAVVGSSRGAEFPF